MSSYVEQNNENEEVDIEKLNDALPSFVIRQQKLRESIDEIVVDSGKGFNMRKFVRIIATCRDFRQVVIVRFFEQPRMLHNSLHRVSQIQLFGNSGQLPYNSPSWKTLLLIIFITSRKWSNLTILKMANSPQLKGASQPILYKFLNFNSYTAITVWPYCYGYTYFFLFIVL